MRDMILDAIGLAVFLAAVYAVLVIFFAMVVTQ